MAPETGSFTSSSLTSTKSDNGSTTGLRLKNSILRPRLAVPASLSSVRVFEPERNTRRRGVFSVMGIASPGECPPAQHAARGVLRQAAPDPRPKRPKSVRRSTASAHSFSTPGVSRRDYRFKRLLLWPSTRTTIEQPPRFSATNSPERSGLLFENRLAARLPDLVDVGHHLRRRRLGELADPINNQEHD